MTSKRSEFYEKGVRFACQGSGRCCRCREGYDYVYVTLQERRRLASFLDLPTHAFTRRFTSREEGHFFLTPVKGACPFLERKRCRVYPARPEQCRTWPFWPENMNEKVWNRYVAPLCPGIGKGRLHSAEEIRAILAAQEEE